MILESYLDSIIILCHICILFQLLSLIAPADLLTNNSVATDVPLTHSTVDSGFMENTVLKTLHKITNALFGHFTTISINYSPRMFQATKMVSLKLFEILSSLMRKANALRCLTKFYYPSLILFVITSLKFLPT